jgi:hypothetical protein
MYDYFSIKQGRVDKKNAFTSFGDSFSEANNLVWLGLKVVTFENLCSVCS